MNVGGFVVVIVVVVVSLRARGRRGQGDPDGVGGDLVGGGVGDFEVMVVF